MGDSMKTEVYIEFLGLINTDKSKKKSKVCAKVKTYGATVNASLHPRK